MFGLTLRLSGREKWTADPHAVAVRRRHRVAAIITAAEAAEAAKTAEAAQRRADAFAAAVNPWDTLTTAYNAAKLRPNSAEAAEAYGRALDECAQYVAMGKLRSMVSRGAGHSSAEAWQKRRAPGSGTYTEKLQGLRRDIVHCAHTVADRADSYGDGADSKQEAALAIMMELSAAAERHGGYLPPAWYTEGVYPSPRKDGTPLSPRQKCGAAVYKYVKGSRAVSAGSWYAYVDDVGTETQSGADIVSADALRRVPSGHIAIDTEEGAVSPIVYDELCTLADELCNDLPKVSGKVLRLMLRGVCSKDGIAARLGIKPQTAAEHIDRVRAVFAARYIDAAGDKDAAEALMLSYTTPCKDQAQHNAAAQSAAAAAKYCKDFDTAAAQITAAQSAKCTVLAAAAACKFADKGYTVTDTKTAEEALCAARSAWLVAAKYAADHTDCIAGRGNAAQRQRRYAAAQSAAAACRVYAAAAAAESEHIHALREALFAIVK